MKTAFVTGAAGFIGGYIARQFADEGWHVIALVHRTVSEHLEHLAREGAATLVQGDLLEADALRERLTGALAGCGAKLDAVVHCAGRASDVGWRAEFRKTNFEAVRKLVRISRELEAGRFVFISTTDVYGLRDYHGESEEELPLGARPENPYPAFKIAAEEFIRRELPAVRYSIVRPAQVWGAGDRTLTPRIVAFLRGSPWIVHFGKWRGANRWPLAHVRNVAMTAYLAATLDEAAGVAVNVVDDERTSMDEFYRLLAAIYLPDKTFKTITLPFWAGRCLGCFISAVSNLLNLDKPFADPSYYALYSVSHQLDFGHARMKALFERAGRIPITREQGLRELAACATHETMCE